VDEVTNRWPTAADTPLDRARAIANSLLRLLPASERPMWTARAHALGETWLGEQPVIHTPDQAITTREAAQLLGVSEDLIRAWACRPHPEDPTRKLLPRFKKDGARRTYLVADVLDAAAAVRRSRGKRDKRPA